MKITKRQLSKLIREAIIAEAGYDQLPYKRGLPWHDPDLQVQRKHDDVDYLDRELTDEEMADAGEWEDDNYPFTVSYAHSKTGEQMEHLINNDEESEDFFRMFFKAHGQSHPYSVD
jgi:hypothetical protein